MATALPSRAFTDVQRYLKQRRATGQVVSPSSERSAWQAYYDSIAANRASSAAIGARERQLDIEEQRVDLLKDQQDAAEGAAKVQGVAEIGSTLALGAMVLKDTSLGGRLGLGTKAAVPSTAKTVGAKGAAPAMGGGGAAASLVHPELQTASTAAPSAAFSGFDASTGAVSGSAGVGGATGLTAGTAAGAGGVGIAAGFVGATIGEKVAGDKGAVAGGLAAGAGAGFMVGGPVGAVIGGVIGGLTGIVKGKK